MLAEPGWVPNCSTDMFDRWSESQNCSTSIVFATALTQNSSTNKAEAPGWVQDSSMQILGAVLGSRRSGPGACMGHKGSRVQAAASIGARPPSPGEARGKGPSKSDFEHIAYLRGCPIRLLKSRWPISLSSCFLVAPGSEAPRHNLF